MYMVINYHGIDISTKFYTDVCNQVLEFKIFLSEKYMIPLSLISWEHICKYINELIDNQDLIVQEVKATTKFSGLTKFVDDKFLMIINKSPNIIEPRLRFTLTHELMHIVLHHSELDLGFKIKLQSEFTDISDNERELQADFAANDLLMSSWLIKDRMGDYYTFKELQNSFLVSESAMQTRLHNYLVFEMGIDFKYTKYLTNQYRYYNDKTICSYVAKRTDFINYFVNFCGIAYPPSIEDISDEVSFLIPNHDRLNWLGLNLIRNDIKAVLSHQKNLEESDLPNELAM